MTIEPVSTRGLNKKEGKSVILYGDSGVGKTTACKSLTEGKALFITFSAEGGAKVLSDTDHQMISIDGESEFNKIFDIHKDIKAKLNTGKFEFKVIIIDSLTELLKCFLFGLMADGNKTWLSMDVYGKTAQRMRQVIRLYNGFNRLGISTIYTALELLIAVHDEEGNEITRIYPNIGKALTTEATSLVDMVGRLELYRDPAAQDVRYLRRIRFSKSPMIMAKTRCGHPDFLMDKEATVKEILRIAFGNGKK